MKYSATSDAFTDATANASSTLTASTSKRCIATATVMIVSPTSATKTRPYGISWCGGASAWPCSGSGMRVVAAVMFTPESCQLLVSSCQPILLGQFWQLATRNWQLPHSDQVQQREQENPNQVDEVPIEAHVFSVRRLELAAKGVDQQD